MFVSGRQLPISGGASGPYEGSYITGWYPVETDARWDPMKKVISEQAFDDNLTSYKHPQNGIPDLFWFNALLIASNGIESRVGTLTADWERFFESTTADT